MNYEFGKSRNGDICSVLVYDTAWRREYTVPLDFNSGGINKEQCESYLRNLLAHVENVRKAGAWLGVPKEQLAEHDETKFTAAEFMPYVRQHHGDKGDPSSYAEAWLHHIHNNEHHWQHWIFPDGYSPKGSNVQGGIVPMPDNYALEMVSDWAGANKTYQGHWDMSKWLNENFGRIHNFLSHSTHQYVLKTLKSIGYSHNMDTGWSYAGKW